MSNASTAEYRSPSILDVPTEVPRGVFINPPAASAAKKLPPWMSYDSATDQVTIDGTKFSADFFRAFSLAPRGTLLRLQERNDGVVEVRVYQRGQTVIA